MKLKYLAGALGFAAAMTGCSLDVKMYDGVMAEDIGAENIPDLAFGSYNFLKGAGVGFGGYPFREFGSDGVTWNGTSTGTTFKLYDYRRNINSTNTEYLWELAYRGIGNNNLVIEMVEKLGADASDEILVLKGENHFLRALQYFYLINEFAQPYSNNPEKNPGLPLKLDANPDVMSLPKSRSTVAEVYAQIEEDLIEAITLMTLPEGMQPKNNNFATKEAAEALLARVYLYMGRFEEAAKMADNVIKSGRFDLEQGERYAKYAQWLPENNKETIFAVRMVKEKDYDASWGNMYIHVDGNGWEEMSPSNPFLQLMELHLDENDMPIDLRSRYIVKRFVEDGVEDYSVYGYPEKSTPTGLSYIAKKKPKQPDINTPKSVLLKRTANM